MNEEQASCKYAKSNNLFEIIDFYMGLFVNFDKVSKPRPLNRVIFHIGKCNYCNHFFLKILTPGPLDMVSGVVPAQFKTYSQ